jgi:hypothetical protein
MRQPYLVRFALFSCLAGVLAVAGCGGGVKGVTFKGQVLHNGKPIQVLPQEEIQVGFSVDTPGAQQPKGALTKVEPADGSFTITGLDGKGIPPGKYRVVVSSQLYQQSQDRFEALFTERLPPLIVEVGPEPGQHFTIDIGTRTVTKR